MFIQRFWASYSIRSSQTQLARHNLHSYHPLIISSINVWQNCPKACNGLLLQRLNQIRLLIQWPSWAFPIGRTRPDEETRTTRTSPPSLVMPSRTTCSQTKPALHVYATSPKWQEMAHGTVEHGCIRHQSGTKASCLCLCQDCKNSEAIKLTHPPFKLTLTDLVLMSNKCMPAGCRLSLMREPRPFTPG